jgi:hypothetical protein
LDATTTTGLQEGLFSYKNANPGIFLKDFGLKTLVFHLVSICNLGEFQDHSVLLLPFWYIFLILVCCANNNLATLHIKKVRKQGMFSFIVFSNLCTLDGFSHRYLCKPYWRTKQNVGGKSLCVLYGSCAYVK